MGKKYKITDLKKNDFSLILSGGSSYGISHIGVLKFLEKNELKPKEIIGTSMGSIIGALFALGKDAREIKKLLKKINNMGILEIHYLPIQKDYEKLHDFLKEIFGQRKISDCQINLKIIATKLATGEGKIFTKKDEIYLCDAVMASISIPGIFPAKIINKEKYIDGGVFSNLGIEFAKKKNIKLASNAINQTKKYIEIESKRKFLGLIKKRVNVLKYSIHYLLENQTKAKIPFIKKLILIEPNLNGFKKYLFDGYEKMIDIGYTETRRYFQNV